MLTLLCSLSARRKEKARTVCLSIAPSLFFPSPLLRSTRWAQSMQFSNHPKEDSVEHVVISGENAEMEAGGETNLGDYESGNVMSWVIRNKATVKAIFIFVM